MFNSLIKQIIAEAVMKLEKMNAELSSAKRDLTNKLEGCEIL